jgi:hypothetical protein
VFILSNEDFIADLTRNGSPAVRADSRLAAGRQEQRFLSTTGFPDISNSGDMA